jgi:hypothetical protein
MIVLNTTSDLIEIVLGGAVATNELEIVSSYRDITTTAYTAGRETVASNGTTDQTIVSSPAASTQRVVDYISVYNKDTANATVTIKLDDGSTEFIITKVTLATLERLEYTNDSGWQVYTSTGAIKNDNTTLASGTYTPTLTNVTNISASTAYQAQYMRVGSTVTVSGAVDIDPTAAGAMELGLSLPIPSNLGAVEDLAGTSVCTVALDDPCYIEADATNDRAAIKSTAINTTNHKHYFQFTYQII